MCSLAFTHAHESPVCIVKCACVRCMQAVRWNNQSDNQYEARFIVNGIRAVHWYGETMCNLRDQNSANCTRFCRNLAKFYALNQRQQVRMVKVKRQLNCLGCNLHRIRASPIRVKILSSFAMKQRPRSASAIVLLHKNENVRHSFALCSGRCLCWQLRQTT